MRAEGKDVIFKPDHYRQGDIECKDAIKAALGDGFEAYCIGNVMKYIWRYRHKNEMQDLEKADVYLMWAKQECMERCCKVGIVLDESGQIVKKAREHDSL